MRGGVFPASMTRGRGDGARAGRAADGRRSTSRAEVTPREMTVHGSGDGPRIAAIDTGIKLSIVRHLVQRGAVVELHPCSVTAPTSCSPATPTSIFLANGPGDPAALGHIVDTRARRRRQAAGVGHLPRPPAALPRRRPADVQAALRPPRRQPPRQGPARRGKIEITSQNHGFAVRPPGGARPDDTVDEPVRWETDFGAAELTHVNLYDGTVEGLTLLDVPGVTVQYHPEAGPGPNDSLYLFDRFLERREGRRLACRAATTSSASSSSAPARSSSARRPSSTTPACRPARSCARRATRSCS